MHISENSIIFASENKTNNNLTAGATLKILQKIMKTTANGMTAIGYMVENPNFIEKGDYNRTELDDYKDSVDFLIISCGKRYEIIFNHATALKTSRSIESISDRAYLVTEKALDSLKEKYTWATDF